MVKFWIKVAMVAACLAAVIIAKNYLSDIAGTRAPDSWSDRDPGPLEVETQAAGDGAKPAGH